jgi:hypothetical protein
MPDSIQHPVIPLDSAIGCAVRLEKLHYVPKKVKTPPWAKRCRLWMGTSVRSQMVDFGSGQGLNVFETAVIAGYFEDFKKVKTPPWAKRCRLWMGTNPKIQLVAGT